MHLNLYASRICNCWCSNSTSRWGGCFWFVFWNKWKGISSQRMFWSTILWHCSLVLKDFLSTSVDFFFVTWSYRYSFWCQCHCLQSIDTNRKCQWYHDLVCCLLFKGSWGDINQTMVISLLIDVPSHTWICFSHCFSSKFNFVRTSWMTKNLSM